MKSIKRFAKRSLSLILCLAMVMTTLIFFEIGITKPEAKVMVNNPSASSELPDVFFYVPEVIYLQPISYSWIGGSTSVFHYFVENTVVSGNDLADSPKTNTSLLTTGNIYFQYNKAKADTVQLSYRWLNSELSETLGSNGIRLGSTDVGNNQNYKASKANGKNYYHVTINADASLGPELEVSDTGCYIEWTIKYHDSVDNIEKSVTAYTYVYKPYVVPMATGVYTDNSRGTNSKASTLSWIT